MVRTDSLKQAGSSRRATVPRHRILKENKGKVGLLRTKIRQVRYLLGVLGSLVVADGIISNFVVRNGLGAEGNPYIRSIVGQTSFVFLKLAAACIGALVLWKIFRQRPRLGLVSIIFFILLYTAILWWNLTTWFIAQHNIQF